MKFKIYSKTNCPYCYKGKQVMELTSSDFIEYTLDKDFTRTEFYDKFGKGSTFPQVVCGSQKIGGSVETIKFLKEHQVIRS